MNNPNTDSDTDIDVDIDIGTSNTAKAPYVKHTSPEVKDVCYFAERIRHMLDVKINHLRKAMQKSDNLLAKQDLPELKIFPPLQKEEETEQLELDPAEEDKKNISQNGIYSK